MGRHLDSLLKRGFRATKCATLLKLTVSRIKLARNQKTNSAKKLRKEIAQLLQSGQDSHAYRLKTEQLVRIQNIIGAYDLIDHYCKLVVSRMQIIDTQRNCPLDVKEAVASLIFAAPRCTDLVDLPRVRDMFTAKYGKEFTAAILELRPDHGVNTQIIELLSTRPATGQAKLKLMQEIAAENNIEWKGENEFTKPPEDLPDKSGKLQPESESSQTGSRRDQASTMISMQSPKILYAGWEDGEIHTGIPAGDTNLNVAIPETGRVSFFGTQTIPGAGIENVSNLPEYGQPLQASQVETGSVSDSESDIEFQDAVEENVSDSKEAAESKMGFQNAVEAEVSVVALNDDSTEGTSQRLDEDGAYLGSGRAQDKDSAVAEQVALHADNLPNARTESPPSEMPSLKSDEVTRMPSQRFYEDGANFGSRGRQFKDLASAAQAALPHEDNVPNARTESSPPSKKASSMSDEATRMPSQRFYEDGADLGSGKRHYKESASAGQAALADEDIPNPPPSEKASSKLDEVPRMHSQKFYEDGVYLGSGKSRQFKDFASAAQAAFESAALAAEAAQAAIFHARQESGSFKYSSFSNSLGAKASATEIAKARPEFNSKLFESNIDPENVTEEPKARPEFDSRIFESNVDPKKVIEEPKARPEIRRKFSDASTVYLDSFPSTNFISARKTEERSDGETSSSSDDDMGGMSNPTWDSEDVSQGKRSPAKSGSGHGYFKKTWDSEDVSEEKRPPAKSDSCHGYFEQKSSRNSEGSADEADGSADDAMINPVSLWNRRVAGARLATEDTYAERPKFDDEEDVPYAYGEHSGRNSLEKMNSGSGSGSVSGEFSSSSSFSTRTLRGSSKHSSFSMGTFEEDAGGEKLRFERSRLPEDSLAGWRGEVFSHKPKFDDEVNDGLLASGTGQFAREDSLAAGRGEVVSHKPKFDGEVNDGLLASRTAHFARVSSGHDREKADAAAVPAPLPVSEAWRRSEAKPRWISSSSNVAEDIQYEQKKTAGRGDSRRTTWARRRPLISPPEAEQQDEATAASATSRKNFAEVDELDIKSYDRSSSSTKVAASEAIGGGGSASAAATLPPRQTTNVAVNDTAVEVGGGGGSASGSAVTRPPPSTHASPAAVHFPPSRQTSKVAADDTAVASRRATKVAADDAAVEAGGDGPPASAAAVNSPPSRQTTKVAANDTAVASRRATNIAADDAAVEAGGDSPSASAAAIYFPPPPPTRPPPPAPTLQLPLRSSPSSLTSPLTPSFSDPVVLASTPPPPHTPSTASTSSSPVPHLSTAASAPPPATRDQLRAPHRHPKLPDYDDFVAHFERLRQESRTSPPS